LPYVGGAFGSGLRPQYELPLAVLAARAQALLAGGLDPATDVHARLSRRQHPIVGAGGRARRPPGRVPPHLADYHVPTNADVQAIDVIFVDEKDDEINPLGIKGVGEIGIVGTAAAIANAVYHATGKRIRDLPITIDKLIRE